MTEFNFKVLKTAWNNVKKNRRSDLQRVAPYLTNPGEIYMKRMKEDSDYLTVQFLGFENSVSDTNSIPQVKRLVLNWIKRFSMDVQTMRGDTTTLIVKIAKEMKFTEEVEVTDDISAKRAELYKLYTKSLKVMPASPAQEKIKARIAELRHELGMNEAAISIFKRDPKTNKSKRYYKCIGGKKHGRRVANPNDCIGFPDFAKKMKFAMSKRQKAGQASIGKKKTQITNIMAKRIRKANMRLKKARGF